MAYNHVLDGFKTSPREIVENEINKLQKLNYNRFFWWRNFAVKQKPLHKYSPLIDIVENKIESEYWFLMHDTCKTGPNFKELLYANIDENLPIKVALTTKPAMSMGLYRYDYLLSVKDKLLSIKNEDYSESTLQEWKTWGVPNEDFILWMTEPLPSLPKTDHTMVFIGNENWYNTGSIRRSEHFPGFDIYKNKSNWGQTSPGNMVIRL